MKLGIYLNKNKIDLTDFLAYLDNNSIEHMFITEKADDLKNINYAVIFGGDGTVLRIARQLASEHIPALSINCGNIGFLTEFEFSEATNAVDLLIEGKLVADERILLEIIYPDGKKATALNELVVQRNSGSIGGELIVKLGVSVDGLLADEVCGDGVIITTPSGSTAYSLSSGGAILAPKLCAIGITPICAHSLHNRPIVCSSESIIEIENKSTLSALLVIDGVIGGQLTHGQIITVKKAKLPFLNLKLQNTNFFEKLKTKLYRRG